MRFVLAVLACTIFFGCSSRQLTKEELLRNQLFRTWSHLNEEEDLRNYSTICAVVDTVLQLSATLPEAERRWYSGGALLSRARAESRLDRYDDARRDVSLAFSAGYRNDAMLTLDTVLYNALGTVWVDSFIREWVIIQREKEKQWAIETPIVVAPKKTSSKKFPIILALHGGNSTPEVFSSHFTSLPDRYDAIFIYPPAPIKYSAVVHCWPNETSKSDGMLEAILHEAKQLPNADSTQIYLMGYSQGAATSIGFSLRHSEMVKGAILFSGFTNEVYADSLLEAAAANHLKLYALSGTIEATVFTQSMHVLSERSKKIGLQLSYEERSGMIHGIPIDIEPQVDEAWNWLHSHEIGAK